MNRKDVIVIRIGLSIESADEQNVTVTSEPGSREDSAITRPLRTTPSTAPRIPQPPPRRSFGRGDSPRDAELGESRAMTDMQKKALFRIAYDLGDKESALGRILEALGVERLEWATRKQASKAIEILGAQRDRPPRRTNGASHD